MYDVIIIGSGPAGMMASIMASKTKKVLLLEKNDISGKKLLLTGNGRCNLTNLKSNNDFINNIRHNKKYLYSIINKFGPTDIYNYFVSNGVKLKEEDNNKIFPVSNRSSEILEFLLKQMRNVTINYRENVISIEIDGENKIITTNKGKYISKNIIIAVGGKSFKITGSTGDIEIYSRMLNEKFIPFYPAEVGLILSEDLSDLAGTSIDNVTIKHKKEKISGSLLFTHKGVSGHAILNISDYVKLNNIKELSVDLIPNIGEEEFIDLLNNYSKDKELTTFLTEFFSKKFSAYLVTQLDMNLKIKGMNDKMKLRLLRYLKEYKLNIKDTDNIDKAFVTGGGIAMSEIDTNTMESKKNKGVYYAGECLDLYGPIGGYNITIALSTGYIAGTSIK